MDTDRNEEREHRINMEIVVDAYNEHEVAMGWYHSLEERMSVPFRAQCIRERAMSPLENGDEVTVVGMPDEEDCMCEMFVLIEWTDRTFGVPLMQLEPVNADAQTEEIVGDWHYWFVEQGYRIC